MDVRPIVVEASSSQVVTRQQRKRAVDAVMFQVLDNPSLREEILKHVIFGKNKVYRKAACTLRLVDRNWDESVVRILRKAHEHLFQLGKVTKEAVDPFVETFAASPQLMGSVPPLAIHAFEFGVLCRPENLESFSNCLTRCGDALIQLGFQITENGRRFEARLPNWSFPCLHGLDISLIQDFRPNRSSRSDGQGELAVEDDDENDDDNLSTCVVKSILSNATCLSELTLNIGGIYPAPASQQPSQLTVFGSVILPTSLIKITTCTVGSIHHLEMLARSRLPNLTLLAMYVGRRPFSDGLIIRILEKFRASLKTFRIFGITSRGQPRTAHVTRFPVMEQLVELTINRVNVEPELGRDSLDKYFPKLTTLHLTMQSTENFQKWTGSSPVSGVTNLRLHLCQNSKASLNVDTTQRVNFVFPNLRKLEVTLSTEHSSGLGYIFREMRQLTDLEINLKCYNEPSTSSDIWDSLLTGVPVDVIARSKVEPDFWENELEEQDLASIKNLSELKKCSLNIGFDGQLRPIPPHPSISDFVFNCALLKMPRLMELHLGRVSSYNVSEEMIAKWRNDGRSLTIINPSTFCDHQNL